MAANAGAVFSGLGQDLVTGTYRAGVAGTPLPVADNTFFETTLNAALKDAGYIGEAGVSIQQGRSFQDIKDMDGNAIDTIQTEANGTIRTQLLELNENNLRNLFGTSNVSVSTSTSTAGNRYAVAVALGEDQDPMVHVFRMKSGKKRAGIIVPSGRFTEIGDISFTASGAAMIDVTIKAIPVYDSTLQKNVDFYLFLDDGAWAISLVPVITSVLPSGASVGQSVAISGSKFTGTVSTTGVKFGGVNATSFSVVSDSLITAVVPAGSAGSAPVVVTNASGASASFPYTRGA